MSKKDSKTSTESHMGECESLWLVSGPPFDQRDYMISPSESIICINNDTNLIGEKKNKLRPCDIKIDSKYLLDTQKALKKLLDLIRDGCAHYFPERLKTLLYKFIQGTPSGFLVEDLGAIIEMVEYFIRNTCLVPEYIEFVKMIVCVAKSPPKMGKTSDIIHSEKSLVDYFTLFGELLATVVDINFQLDVLEVLDWLIVRRGLVDVNCVKLSFCHEAMEKSQLPYIIATLMETVCHDLYVHYLELALQMLSFSLSAGCIMILNNLLDFVLRRLNSHVKYADDLTEDVGKSLTNENCEIEYYKVLDKSGYLIWGLLSIIANYGIDAPSPGEEALRSVRFVFQEEASKKTQKSIDTRNNFAAIIIKLYVIFGERLPIVTTGLVGDIALLSVATEIPTKDTWAAKVELGTSKEDYILKKLMLLGCCLLANNNMPIEILKSSKFIKGVLCLINPKAPGSWIPSQFVTLLFIALQTLSEIVPLLPEEYILYKGNMRLLSAMTWFMEENCDQDALLQTLKTFCTIVTCKDNKCIIEDIKAQNGTHSLLELCSYLLDVKCMKIVHQEIFSRAFVVLETLFKNDRKLQIKFRESCVTISIKLLKRILADFEEDSKWNPKALVSFGIFLWEAVAWCNSSLELFIEEGGIFLILDFIEFIGSFPVQMLFMGVLVDMTDEGKTIGHLLTWRGKDGYGILSMMIDIWRKEESFTKVHRTKNGLIRDIETSLMTEEQWFLTHQIRDGHFYSPSIAEMICSARPKIHALYQFLQHRYFLLTQIGELSYCLQLKNVKPLNQVYIPLVEHFLALKMGEIWSEVLLDTSNSGIIPTSFDGEFLCTLIDEKNKWASRIKTLQEEILLVQRGVGVKEEDKLYNFLKSCGLSTSLEALRNLDYLARTSFQKFQRQKKEKQTKEVENSLNMIPFSSDNLHRTFLHKTNVTTFCGDYVWINSEKEMEHEDVVILSSESSSDNILKSTDEY